MCCSFVLYSANVYRDALICSLTFKAAGVNLNTNMFRPRAPPTPVQRPEFFRPNVGFGGPDVELGAPDLEFERMYNAKHFH